MATHCRFFNGPTRETEEDKSRNKEAPVSSQPVYDVIVVGSGAAGGIAAYVLTLKGLNVLCL